MKLTVKMAEAVAFKLIHRSMNTDDIAKDLNVNAVQLDYFIDNILCDKGWETVVTDALVDYLMTNPKYRNTWGEFKGI